MEPWRASARPPGRPVLRPGAGGRGPVQRADRGSTRPTPATTTDRGSGRRRSTSRRCSTRSGSRAEIIESEPGRSSLVARWGGADADRSDALLLHGHLDVVPSAPEDWQVHPLSGEVRDGYVWGRGAVDMKDFDAMLLSVVRARAAGGRRARPAPGALLHRRRGGRRAQGGPGRRRRPPRPAGGLHRGGRRGGRLQHHDPRPSRLPGRGRREGDGLDAADRPRSRRARLDDQPGERRHLPGRRGRPDRRARVAGAAHAHHGGAARQRRPSSPAPRPRRRTPRHWSTSSAAPRGCWAR